MNALREFLEERSAKFDTLQTLATHMGVTFSGFLRGVKQGTLSAENCLRLAEVLGEEPAAVFRAAKKPGLADQFERLYGTTTNPMTEEERALVTDWRALPSNARQGFRLTLDAIRQSRVSGSDTAGAGLPRSAQNRDGDTLATARVPDQVDPIPRPPHPRAQVLAAFKKATAAIEAADARKARRHAAAARPHAAGGGARGRTPRR